MAEPSGRSINGEMGYDEALELALAMSLGRNPAASRRDAGSADSANRNGDEEHKQDRGPASAEPEKTNKVSAAGSAFAGLDRKKMEEERLARLKKRKALELDDDLEGPEHSRRQKIENNDPGRASTSVGSGGIIRQDKSSRDSEAPTRATNESQGASSSRNGTELAFPRGAVKRTWARGQPRLGDDITIEEVLQKDRLEMAVLSSFQWDEEWLISKLDFTRTNVILVAFAANETQAQEMRSNVPGAIKNKLRFSFPPMQTMGYMHSKLQLLKYKDSLRVVVPTGNLVSYDWGESGLMENMVFLIDLPKVENPDEGASNTLTPFGEELCYFLLAQGLDEQLVKSLRKYDFSETSRYAFVHTIAGSHTTDDSWRRTGYCGLGRAVSSLGIGSENPLDVDYMCSSIGSVKLDLLKALYYACQGDSGLKEYEGRTSKTKGKNDAPSANDSVITERFRVYFPSRDTVIQSRGGKNAAGTICFQSQWWNSPQFPRSILRDSKSTKPGLLMHSKVIFVRTHSTGAGGESRGYAYIGSANLSESAWGRLVKDRATGKIKLTCRNWECGVLVQAGRQVKDPRILTASTTAKDKVSEDGQDGSDALRMFEGCIPIPMQLPGKPLVSANGSTSPWFFLEER